MGADLAAIQASRANPTASTIRLMPAPMIHTEPATRLQSTDEAIALGTAGERGVADGAAPGACGDPARTCDTLAAGSSVTLHDGAIGRKAGASTAQTSAVESIQWRSAADRCLKIATAPRAVARMSETLTAFSTSRFIANHPFELW